MIKLLCSASVLLSYKEHLVARLVIIESPYKNDDPAIVQANEEYARRCMRDCLNRGEAPWASHLLYTQVLNEDNPAERELGINAGLDWGQHAEATVVYLDRGISEGMIKGILRALQEGRVVEPRSLNGSAQMPDQKDPRT